jgi:hypothetical protein
MVFITVVERVYSVVWPDSLYKADYVSLLTVPHKRTIYRVVEKFQTYSVLDKNRIRKLVFFWGERCRVH